MIYAGQVFQLRGRFNNLQHFFGFVYSDIRAQEEMYSHRLPEGFHQIGDPCGRWCVSSNTYQLICSCRLSCLGRYILDLVYKCFGWQCSLLFLSWLSWGKKGYLGIQVGTTLYISWYIQKVFPAYLCSFCLHVIVFQLAPCISYPSKTFFVQSR